MNFLVSGLLNIETTLKIREFPINYYPIDYPFFGINSNVSGVAYNISSALLKLNNSVDLVSYLGDDDEGKRVLSHLNNDKLSLDLISKDIESTPASVILYDTEGKRQIYCDLKDIQDKTVDVENPLLLKKLEECDIAVLCNINFNRTLLKKAKELNKTIASDVHVLSDINDEYNKDFLACADILFLSDEKLPCNPEDFIMSIEEKYHNKIIVMGRGSKGAMIYFNQEIYIMDAVLCEKVVNTVGAGDSLFSSFLNFYSKGFSPIEALKRAQCFATVKIGFNGASVGFVTENEVEEKYSKTEFNVKRIK